MHHACWLLSAISGILAGGILGFGTADRFLFLHLRFDLAVVWPLQPLVRLLEFIVIHITGAVLASFATGASGILFHCIALYCAEHSLQYGMLFLVIKNSELGISDILANHSNPQYFLSQRTVMDHAAWQLNPTDTGYLEVQCTGLGGAELDADWDVLVACKKEAHVYGPSLSKQDDWPARAGTVAGSAHTQEYLLLHVAMLPIGLHAWCHVLGVPNTPQIQAQIASRAKRLLNSCPILPAHRKLPWPGYKQGMRLFTKLLVAHPLVGICRPPEIAPADLMKSAGYMTGSMFIRGHSAGSYAGMVLERILAEFPDIEGRAILAAIALPPSLLTNHRVPDNRRVQLIHHADDKLCVWTPSNQDLHMLHRSGFAVTYVTGWRAYLGNAQHNYAHWTKVNLPEGKRDLASLEHIQGVLPFEVYAQAPLRLISWCSFELPMTAKRLLRKLAIMCEDPNTSTEGLVATIAKQQDEVHTEQDATRYLANLAIMNIATRGKLPEYTTMVQEFLSTLPLPMTVYMLDYYLPMLSPNEGYNETGLTQQSAGPIRDPMQEIRLMYQYKGSEFGHWRVTGGWDAFAFRHPSLGQTDVYRLLESDAHHHKVSPIGTGRLIALVGVEDLTKAGDGKWQILFGLVLSIAPKTTKNKNELPAARIHRQCNPKFLEVAFLSEEAINFFAHEQLGVLRDRYLASGEGLTILDAAVINGKSKVPTTFRLKGMWMYGCTKPTGEITAVARTPPCRCHLGLGIYNVQVAVEGMDGNKKNHLLHLCGQLLRMVLIPCHIESEPHSWTRTTALSFAAELDGHVLGTLCAVTMALLTNRRDLCVQGLFGAGKSKSMAVLLLALLELDETENMKILFLCKENSGTRSFADLLLFFFGRRHLPFGWSPDLRLTRGPAGNRTTTGSLSATQECRNTNWATRTPFADLLLWLQPPDRTCKRIGRVVGDQERNKSSHSQTRFDILREREEQCSTSAK